MMRLHFNSRNRMHSLGGGGGLTNRIRTENAHGDRFRCKIRQRAVGYAPVDMDTGSEQVSSKSYSTQEVYETLRRMIMDFELAPGARVTETELADQFRVSRTPIREALHRLETEELLTIRPKQGCFIRQVDIEEISNYYDVRVGLEAMAVELACQHMPDEALRELAERWNPRYRAVGISTPEKIRHLEESFHMDLAGHSGNAVLARYLRDVNDRIRVVRRLGFPNDKSIADTFEEHFRICVLLIKRDADASREAMTKHIRKSQKIACSVTLSQLQQQVKVKRNSKTRLL